MKKDAAILLWENGAPLATGSGPEDCPGMTPYLVQSAKPTSAVIVCPGGGYGGRAEHEKEPIAQWLNSIGISSFVLDYRVAPYKYPAQLFDGKRAIRLVRNRAKEFNVDPNRIGILGFSAGGHFVSMLGTHFDLGKKDDREPVERESCRPDLLILCYPVITFGEFRHDGTKVNLIGENAAQELIDSLSNEKQVTSDTPPSFIWHTRDDDVVPVENAFLFAQALRKNNVPFELHIFESGVHGLGLAQDKPGIKQWTKLCEEWLRERGF